MIRRLPATRQHDRSDCGAACLHAIARYHRLRIPLARIRQLTRTDPQGTNVLGIIEGATRLGFQAKGIRAAPATIGRVPTPAIAHLVLPDGAQHFVVLHRVRRGRVEVMDPAVGRRVRSSEADFLRSWSGVLILLAPGSEFRPLDEEGGSLQRFWKLLHPHRTVILEALFGAAIYTLLGLATAIYVQNIVDHVLIDANRNLLNLLSVAMLGLMLARACLGTMKNLLTLRTGQRIDAALILGYYEHLLRLPQSFFDTMRVGEITSRVNDAVKIRAFINDVALDLVVNALVVLFSFGLMFTIHPALAFVLAAILPLYFLVHQITNRINRRILRRIMEEGAELESHFVESIGSMSTVKRLGLEPVTKTKAEIRFVRLLRSIYTAARTNIFSASTTELISTLAMILLFWRGSLQVIDGSLTPGELLSFYALLGYLTGPATQLVLLNRTIQDALIASDRLFEIMDLEREGQRGTIVLPAGTPPSIRFEGVAFRHGNRPPLFDGIDLTIEAGVTTAIVGESGSGKSTLMALCQNLYPISAGKIRIGGHDLLHLDREALHSRIAAVPQEIHLFSGTLLENIAPRDPEPDLARVVTLCEQLGMIDFIELLPHSLHTRIGEQGVALSGGERQRVAIARALYRAPDLLILDEGTSNLDPSSERRIQQALREFQRADRTLVLIAHRLASVVHADRIVVLAGGKVVESGDHASLLAADGIYTRLWRDQGMLPFAAQPDPLATAP